MGETCSTHNTGEKYTKFWAETLNRQHPDINGRVILIRVLKEMLLGVWTGLEHCRAFVKAVIFGLAERLPTSQKGLLCMKVVAL